MKTIVNNIITVIYFAFAASMLSSCEEVIDIDLNSSNPVLVIDAQIELNKSIEAAISYTTDYYDVEDPKYVENATVVLSTSSGKSEELTYLENGSYKGSTIKGKEGIAYTLTVIVDDKSYAASTNMLAPTKIVEINTEETDSRMNDGEYYELEINFTNNINEENYYLIKYDWVDEDGKQNRYSTLSHKFFSNEDTVSYAGMRNIYGANVTVDIKLYSVDEGTYDYYSALNDINGNGMGGSTPYNPTSNFGKDVMGYFRAWSIDTAQITMPSKKEVN